MFADVDNRMSIAQDEIFGPVACLIRFKTEDEALAIANDVRYGLSSYVFTESTGRALRMARGIEAGMVFVNSQNVRDLRQPFGGVKASGTGREGGHWSFEVFTEIKNVCVSLGGIPFRAGVFELPTSYCITQRRRGAETQGDPLLAGELAQS